MQNLAVGADGFAVIDREWKAGDAVTLRFPMTPKVETMRDFNDGGKPYCSLVCGPLLFAYGLPEQDESGRRCASRPHADAREVGLAARRADEVEDEGGRRFAA